MGLKRVVGRDAGGGVGLRLGGVADIGDAEVDIPALKRLLVGLRRLSVGAGQIDRRAISIDIRIAGGGSYDRVAVSVVLLKTQRVALQNGIGGRRDQRLVEGQGNDFVTAEVAH